MNNQTAELMSVEEVGELFKIHSPYNRIKKLRGEFKEIIPAGNYPKRFYRSQMVRLHNKLFPPTEPVVNTAERNAELLKRLNRGKRK